MIFSLVLTAEICSLLKSIVSPRLHFVFGALKICIVIRWSQVEDQLLPPLTLTFFFD